MKKFLILIVALRCVLLTASMAWGQRYTVYGKAGASGSYTTIGVNQAAKGPGGPPDYLLSSRSVADPGPITPLFVSRAPTGTVTTDGSATVVRSSGDSFSSTYGSTVRIGGTSYTVANGGFVDGDHLVVTQAVTVPTGSAFVFPKACIGDCQNAKKYDTTINPAGVNCYTRVMDGSNTPGGGSVGNLTSSGGANNNMWSLDEDYFGVSLAGGSVLLFQVTTNADGCAQIVNSGRVPQSVTGSFTWSRVTNKKFYVRSSGSLINSYTFTDINSLPAPVPVVDFMTPGLCPGFNLSSVSTSTVLTAVDNDARWTMAVSGGVQNTAFWVLSYDVATGQCAAANFATGQWWHYQLGGSTATPADGTFSTVSPSCWGANIVGQSGGIHDGVPSLDGKVYEISISPTWTKGACAGNPSSNQFAEWQIGTGNIYWCSDSGDSQTGHCGSHEATGYTHTMFPSFNGWNIRPIPDVSHGFTDLGSIVPNSPQDSHQTWIHPNNDDSFPAVLGKTSLVNPTMGAGCSKAIYCPQYMQNTIFAGFIDGSNRPPAQFGHTFACNYDPGTTPGVAPAYAQCDDGIANVNGTAVTWVSGNKFVVGWTGNMYINEVRYVISSCASETSCTLTTSAGTQTGATYGRSDGFGSGDAIGNASPKGHYFLYVSSMLHGLGLDKDGSYRADAFLVHLQ